MNTSESTPEPVSPTEASTSSPAVPPPLQRNRLDWIWRLLAGNPFYPISALVLLWGAYRLTVDPQFFSSELRQLVFNFGSLQFYELLVVATAVFLARRRIWYDSTQLVLLENLLVFVPFILVSQAIFLGPSVLWSVGLAGCLLAAARQVSLKLGISVLNLPPRLLTLGSAFLAVHLSLPIVFRQIQSVGDAVTGGDILHGAILQTWWFVGGLPLLTVLLPRSRHWGGLLPGRSWLPLVLVGMWTAATAVHLAAIGYVYDLRWHWRYLVPVVWAAVWALYLRLEDLTPEPDERWVTWLQAAPVPVAWAALVWGETGLFRGLTLLNLAGFAALWRWGTPARQVRELLLLSAASFVAGTPLDWVALALPECTRIGCVGISIAAYLLVRASFSRLPAAGFGGAVVATIAAAILLEPVHGGMHLTLQIGLVYLLAHSLRWPADANEAATAMRWGAAAGWLLNSWWWTANLADGQHAFVWGGALLLLGLLGLGRWLTGRWEHPFILGAALLVLLVLPARMVAEQVRTAPVGVIALAASLVLFGLGTGLALTRQFWNRTADSIGLAEPVSPADRRT